MISRDLALNLALLGISLLVGLVLVEGTLTIADVQSAPNLLCAYQADSETGHVLKPGLSGAFQYPPEIDMNFSINSYGMRGAEPNPKYKKVFLLGDSMSFGYATNLEESYAEKVNQALHEKGYELLNYSVPGIGALRETILLKRALKDFHPDLVVIGVTTANDWSDNYTFSRYGPTNTVDDQYCLVTIKPKTFAEGVKTWLYRNLRTARLLNNALRKPNSIEASAESFDRYAVKENQLVKDSRQITRDAFREIAEVGHDNNFPILMFLIPPRVSLDKALFDSEIAKIGNPADYNRNRERDHYLQICEANGFICIRPRFALEEKMAEGHASAEYYNTQVDHHLNAAGNQALAEVLTPEVLKILESYPFFNPQKATNPGITPNKQ